MVQVLEKVTKEELGRRLSMIRAYLELTLEDVESRSAALGDRIPTSTLSGYERGHRFPPLERLTTLCRCYDGADMGALLSSEPDWFSRVWSNPELLVPAA